MSRASPWKKRRLGPAALEIGEGFGKARHVRAIVPRRRSCSDRSGDDRSLSDRIRMPGRSTW